MYDSDVEDSNTSYAGADLVNTVSESDPIPILDSRNSSLLDTEVRYENPIRTGTRYY